MVETSSGKPYTQVEEEGYIVREFAEDVSQRDLVWHRDRSDRTIQVIEGTGWKFQIDNELPFDMEVGDEFSVEAFEYHRLIKGKGKLLLKIIED